MKAKLKLDQKVLQQFFLEHGEKIAFAAIMGGILWMVYQAVIHEGYKKQPQELIEKSTSAKQRVDRTPADARKGEIKNAPYETIVNNMLSTSKVDEKYYPCPNPWDRDVAPARADGPSRRSSRPAG